MEYIITGIQNCFFQFNHYPASPPDSHFGESKEKYEGKIELEVLMFKGKRATPANQVTKTLITFLYEVPTNVVVEETKERVLIHVPINFYSGFYDMLCQGIDDRKYKIIVETEGQLTMTFARFRFIPR